MKRSSISVALSLSASKAAGLSFGTGS
jgi:hypothetical protein